MANAFYSQLATLIAEYVGEDKAKLAIDRQLDRIKATDENVEKSQFPEILNFLMGSIKLYLPDKAKQEEIKSKLQAIA